MERFALFVNRARDMKLEATKEIVGMLKEYGKEVFLDRCLSAELGELDVTFVEGDELFSRGEMIIALGGDGTILKVVDKAAEHSIPVAGINLGHLGFLAQVERDDLTGLRKIIEGDFTVSDYMMLEAQIVSEVGVKESFVALNDIIVKGAQGNIISLEAEVNGTVAAKYLADGIIVSSSTGSTAYSLSCGGPIVHKGLDCILLTPVCPHTLKSRCIIVPPEETVVVRFDSSYCNQAELRIDGNSPRILGEGEYVRVVRAKRRVPLVSVNSRNYFDVIREKLAD